MSTNPEARAWLRVRADALRANYARLRAAAGSDPAVIPMVKADAYGLGTEGVVSTLGPLGPWGWGVATLGEGLRLRGLGVSEPVVAFAPLLPEELEAAVLADLHVSVSSVDALERVADVARGAGTTTKVHVDVDTGMGRTGFDWRNAAEWWPRVAALTGPGPGCVCVGCFTHLHSAEDDESSVHEQWSRFQDALSACTERPRDILLHVLNSAGTFAVPGYALGAIRPGIFLYGGGIGPGHAEPDPVVSLHARVCHVRDAAPGTSLGYGATYRAAGAERWATLSVGYGDGFPRALGDHGDALLGGRRVPIIGRISMDLTVVDISDLPEVRVGDVATLLGADGEEEITLDEVAELAGTISYEILTGFTRRLPRVWT